MRVVVGLGANLGDRLGALREATARLARVARLLARSNVWETVPVGGPVQPDFLNAALSLHWSRSPLELLAELAGIESSLGRVRRVKDGPRTIDLDILWIEGITVNEPSLVVPHPRLHVRAFALAPLLEVAPDAVDPRTGVPYALPSGPSGIRRLDVSL